MPPLDLLSIQMCFLNRLNKPNVDELANHVKLIHASQVFEG